MFSELLLLIETLKAMSENFAMKLYNIFNIFVQIPMAFNAWRNLLFFYT